jgi:hypothetical protein
LRKTVLEKIHYSHLGYNKYVKLSEESVFWPTIRNEIKLMIDSCPQCQKYTSSLPPEPMQAHEIHSIPWYKLGSDIYEINGVKYLIVIDYYSKFVEVEQLNNIISHAIINKFKAMFAHFGVPSILVSDGGKQYDSAEFKNFVKEWGFKQVITSPTYSQSNGVSERLVQTVKKMIKKVPEEKKEIFLALLQLRNTPIFDNKSPNEIIMSRCTRNPLLPTQIHKLKPHVIDHRKFSRLI